MPQFGHLPSATPVLFTEGYTMMHTTWSGIKEVPYCF